ncbi:hypothetical protein Pen01_40510 [Phytomonospora endophytica]|nr:hypothetical protein Pen01_40510 [Phytomonospora endophytica]
MGHKALQGTGSGELSSRPTPSDDSDASVEPIGTRVGPTWIDVALASLRHTRANLKAVRRSIKITAPSVIKVQTCAHDLGSVDTMLGADRAAESIADADAHVQAAFEACAEAIAVFCAIEKGDPIPGIPGALGDPSESVHPSVVFATSEDS